MQRLIDADKHIEYLNAKRDVCLRFDDVLGAQIYQVAIDEIKGADGIDAEPVVRCKDCKHHYINEDRIMCNIFCTVFAVSKNHYCSYGAKMDEEQR